MGLYERFRESREDGFREQFVKPLLARMGFCGISDKHAVKEFGRNYVFSELDPFGQFRHLLAHVEHREKLAGGVDTEPLVDRLRQCFFLSYVLPGASGEQRSLSSIYVFNTGEIAPAAEKQVRQALPKTVAANIHFLDGERLEVLANGFLQRHHGQVRERLEALLLQLKLNVHIWEELRKGINPESESQTWDVRGGILHGLENFLTHPLLPDRIPVTDVAMLWQRAKTIQAVATRNYLVLVPPETRASDLRLLLGVCKEAIDSATALRARIKQALEQMPAVMV